MNPYRELDNQIKKRFNIMSTFTRMINEANMLRDKDMNLFANIREHAAYKLASKFQLF